MRTVAELRRARAEERRAGASAGFVPTLGFLHEGHLSLVDRARGLADRTVVSIFVNPTQFGPDEDLEAYPRDLERDVEAAAERGVDLVFAPDEREMYPVPQTVWVDPGPIAARLCGASRPGHFRGVLTVVAKLFAIVEPDVAVFGRKDFQQSVLVSRMVEELRLPVRVEVAPIVREADGLAMSSRNTYLSPGERQTAGSVPRALREARARYAAGERDAKALEAGAASVLREAGARVEYVEVVDPTTLERLERARPEAICALAAHVGETRLIDNAPLSGPSTLEEGLRA